MSATLPLILLTAAVVGAAAGYLGSFMVLKRMSLVGDALSHVALPGMALALLFHLNPMLGALTSLTLAVLGIWLLSRSSRLYPDALVGIFFTASLAIGILITPEPELLEALFGDITALTTLEGLLATLASLILIYVTYRLSKPLFLGILSEDLAQSSGIANHTTNLIYLLLIGAVVALGVKFVGTLLTGALVIIPAAAAKNVSRSLHLYSYLSIFFGIISATTGIFLASLTSFPPGPIVILTSVAFFLLTLLFKRLAR